MILTQNAGKDAEWKEISYIAGANAVTEPLWKTIWQIFTKVNKLLPYDPAIALLNIFNLVEIENFFHMKNGTWMFIGVLFTIC